MNSKVTKEKIAITELTIEVNNIDELNKVLKALRKIDSVYEVRRKNNKELKMILKELKIETWIGEPTNCYIILDEETKETYVIDPGGEADKIIEMLNILEAKLKYIYLTHCHGDHIGAIQK